jgi:Family of unknown function (DUF6328)
MVYRRRLKQQLVRIADRLALSGLLLLLATMGSALLLIFDVALGMHRATFMAAGAQAWFVTWWFILPEWIRIRHQDCAHPGRPARPYASRGGRRRAQPDPGRAEAPAVRVLLVDNYDSYASDVLQLRACVNGAGSIAMPGFRDADLRSIDSIVISPGARQPPGPGHSQARPDADRLRGLPDA